MKDRIDITLRIADVALSLKVKPEDEQQLREAAKDINDAWSLWRAKFADNSPTEVLAMVTLLFAKSYLALKAQSVRAEEMLAKLEDTIDSLLVSAGNAAAARK